MSMHAFYLLVEDGTEFYMEVIAKIKDHDSKQDGGLQNESFPHQGLLGWV